MQVRSAWLSAPWQVELRTVDLPDTPPPGWARVRVEACGVCGTDLSAAEANPTPHAFGHEIAGRIAALGHGVDHLAAGQTVVLESASFCGHCAHCRNGRVDLCNQAPNFWGQAAMGFADELLAPACCLVPYTGLTPDVACLTEPAGVAYDLVKVAGVTLGDRVAVIGPGPIGLAAAALARHGGATRTLVVGRAHHASRLAVAAGWGCETLATDSPLDALPDLARAFDHVLLTAPVELIEPSLALLDYEGRLSYVGIGTGNPRIGFDANDFHFRKLQLRASFASPAVYFPRVLALLQAGLIPGEALVSHRFPLAEIGAAMALLRDSKAATLKVVVNP